MGFSLSGDLIWFVDLNSIFKWNAFNDLGEGVKSSQPVAIQLSTLSEFKHHMQHAISG